jgi:amidase
MTDITTESASRITHLIKTREISPVEVVNSLLRRCEQLNPTLNAIVTFAPSLREKAREAEASLMSGEAIGPLHGLPLTIKDTIEVAGLSSTSGSAVRANFIPAEDAPAVARLKAAGAIVLGKTNPAEMAMDYTADNPVFGRTNNPYNLSYTPGGSSGGEAAAIAACMSPAGLGSDLAGSVRVPSHFCGIAGLKPTTRRVPGGGQFPPSCGPYSLGAVVGPMARAVEDLELLFRVLIGEGSLRDGETDLGALRIAWFTDDGVAPVNEETRVAVKSAARALTNAGLRTEETRPPGVELGHQLWLKLFSRASVVQLREVYKDDHYEKGSFVSWRLATADDTPPPTLDEYIKAWMERDRLRESLLKWMNDVPILVTPVGATNAYPHDTLKVKVGEYQMSVFKAFSYSQMANVFDLPAVVVPVGLSANGLPMGVQILGRPCAEKQVLAIARIIEKEFGGWRAPTF